MFTFPFETSRLNMIVPNKTNNCQEIQMTNNIHGRYRDVEGEQNVCENTVISTILQGEWKRYNRNKSFLCMSSGLRDQYTNG